MRGLLTVAVVPLLSTGIAFADDRVGAAPESAGVQVATQLPLGAVATPATAAVRIEGGWTGGGDHAIGTARFEVRAWHGLSLLGGAQLGEAGDFTDGARPRVGAAYEFRAAAPGQLGVRAQVEYKPEGFTEPEGEVEASLAATHVGPTIGAVALIYGQDPEGNERDVELYGAAARPLGGGLVLGAMTRTRVGLGAKIEDGRRWDTIGAAYAGEHRGRLALELTGGVHHVALTDGGRTGPIVLLGAGASW